MISSRHQFIYIHIKKTAGNSISERLLPYCDDTISQKRKRVDGKDFLDTANQYKLGKHASCQSWVDVLGERNYCKYFVFSVIRNPWDRMISHFFHQRKWKQERTDFDHDAFIEWLGNSRSAADMVHYKCRRFLPLFSSEPKLGVAYFLKYESLGKDWEHLCSLLKIPHEPLNHRNKGEHESYQQYYNTVSCQMVEKLCRWEIEYFGYRF